MLTYIPWSCFQEHWSSVGIRSCLGSWKRKTESLPYARETEIGKRIVRTPLDRDRDSGEVRPARSDDPVSDARIGDNMADWLPRRVVDDPTVSRSST